MTQHHSLLGRGILPAVLVTLLLLPGVARAQEMYTFTAGLLGGIGGSLDAEPGDDLSNTGYQVNLTMVTEPRTHLGVRLGQLGLDADELFGSLTDAELSYITVSGEYRFPQIYYESGLYIGLDAPFAAVIQIIVYAGAIMVLFLFVVMLLNAPQEDAAQ